MTHSEPPSHKTAIADIEINECNTPVSRKFDDVYFSKENGLDESYYVFFQGNQLDNRWSQKNFGLEKSDKVFSIGETGFGTGLNFLMSWREWRNAPSPKPRLHFYSTEKFPLSKDSLKQALDAWPELEHLSKQLIDLYPPQAHNGLFRLTFEKGQVALNIYFGDASEGFQQLLPCKLPNKKIEHFVQTEQSRSTSQTLPRIHAWFFDGFAPSKNPSMWKEDLFEAAAKLSNQATTFSTFTASGNVRRLLSNIGFNCEKRKGFGKKREMLVGTFQSEKPIEHREEPLTDTSALTTHFKIKRGAVTQDHDSWHVSEQPPSPIQHCIIIGGGLSGCHIAHALATRGIHCTIIEKNSQLANEASGNKQGIVYAKLSPHRSPNHGPLSYFNYYAFLFANAFYRSNDLYKKAGNECGLLQLAINDDYIEQTQAFVDGFQEQTYFQWLNAEKSSRVAGIAIQHPALFIQNTGWLSPQALCHELTKHEYISIRTNAKALSLVSEGSHHTVTLEDTTQISADAIVFANAHQAIQFGACEDLPLKSIRGQVTHLTHSESIDKLNCIVCGDGYVAPSHSGESTTGASFNLKETSSEISVRDHQLNIEKLYALSPDFSKDYPIEGVQNYSGRVGFRCTTPDYFPIAGPLPNRASMIDRFYRYTKKANAHIENTGAFINNSYALLGLGSRGLTYAPLAAEIIASQMCKEFSPIEQDIVRHLHPARFLIRDLKRNKL